MPVYFIRNTRTNNVKIGMSKDPKARLGNLQTGNDDKLRLELVVDDWGEQDEAALHKRFADLLVRGEWFNASYDGTSPLAEFIYLMENYWADDDSLLARCRLDPETAFAECWKIKKALANVTGRGENSSCGLELVSVLLTASDSTCSSVVASLMLAHGWASGAEVLSAIERANA